MITHSYTKFGNVFSTAVSDVMLIVIRKDESATGHGIAIEVKIWASASARTANADPIDKRKVMFGDSFASTFRPLNRPIGGVFDGSVFTEKGKMNIAIEKSLLNLPEWSGGVIS